MIESPTLTDALREMRKPKAYIKLRGPKTSKDAGAGRRRRGPNQRQRTLLAIRDAGEYGRTNYELSLDTGILRNCVAARVLELRETDLVVDSGDRRATDTDSPAVVWVLTDLGREAAARLEQ